MGFFLAATLFFLASCAAPMQEGGVTVMPGAGARMLIAMRYGMAPVGEAVRPAEARRAVVAEQLPPGAAKSGKLGDYVLDNGIVGVVIGNVDGSGRSGKLIDFARWGGDGDDLVGLDIEVLGAPVRYQTIKTGYDPALAAAYVSVTGDLVTHAGGRASVETRYDLAPGLDAVLVSTRIKIVASEPASDESEPSPAPTPLLVERVGVLDGRSTLADTRGPFLAELGPFAGYALQPAADGELGKNRVEVSRAKTPGVGGTFLYARTLTALERPDSLAAEVAYARTLGEPFGDLEVRVGPAVDPRAPGDIELVASTGRHLTARAVPACGTPRGYRVRAPAGSYAIGWRGEALASSDGAHVDVASDRLTFVDVATRPSAEPYEAPPRLRRCPKDDGPEP